MDSLTSNDVVRWVAPSGIHLFCPGLLLQLATAAAAATTTTGCACDVLHMSAKDIIHLVT